MKFLTEFRRDLKHPAEYWLLVALVVVLPLLEAPKNILWFVYAVTWIVNRIRDRDAGGAWDRWDSLIAVWIVSGYIVAAFAGLHHNEWRGANDILRYGSVLWLVKRGGYPRDALRGLLVTLAISTLIAIGYALWSLYGSHARQSFELHSVGFGNHSAIYLVIAYGALLAALLAYWPRLGTATRVAAVLVVLIIAGSVFIPGSRAAAGALLLLGVALGVVWARRSRYVLAVLAVLSLVAIVLSYGANIEIVQKQSRNVENHNVLAFRDQIWNTAFTAWRQFPLFGVGMDNYNQISPERIRQWKGSALEPRDLESAAFTAHAHSLYLNTLAERGLFGAGALLAVLLAWGYGLVRALPKRGDEDIGWALWGASFSAWAMNVGIGLVNTTLHHEYGLLSALLLGMWLAYLQQVRADSVSGL